MGTATHPYDPMEPGLSIIWIDARLRRGDFKLAVGAGAFGSICHISTAETLGRQHLGSSTHLLVIEFDDPPHDELVRLSVILRQARNIPTVMLTEFHSEDLAVWAFRSGVIDYVITPIPTADFLAILASAIRSSPARRPSEKLLPPPIMPTPPRGAMQPRTAPAVRYMLRNLNRRIVQKELADLCHLSVGEFSRAFRRDHGCCYRDFLLRGRVDAAAALLASNRQVGEIAYEVGFGDPSQFSRHFRNLVWQSPTQFRANLGELTK